jgi:hypothetical protein
MKITLDNVESIVPNDQRHTAEILLQNDPSLEIEHASEPYRGTCLHLLFLPGAGRGMACEDGDSQWFDCESIGELRDLSMEAFSPYLGLETVFVADSDWFDVVTRDREIELDPEYETDDRFEYLVHAANRGGAEWEGYEPIHLSDPEAYVSRVTAVHPRHERIRVGDVVVGAIGGSHVFLGER